MNKKNLLTLFNIISSIIILILIFIMVTRGIKRNSIKKLYNEIEKEFTIEELKDNVTTYNYTFVASVSNGKKKANVLSYADDDITNAYNNLKKDVIKFVIKNNIKAKYLRIDLVTNSEITNTNSIYKDFVNHRYNDYSKGIILNNYTCDDIYKIKDIKKDIDGNDILPYIYLPSSLLNFGDIFNYESSNNVNFIDIDNLNEYLLYNNKFKINSVPFMVMTYDQVSFFSEYDKDEKEYHSYKIINDTDSDRLYLNKREVKDIKEEIKNVLPKIVNYMYSLITDEGYFEYYINIKDSNYVDDEYNLLRHYGSTLALIRNYDKINDKDKNKKEKIASLFSSLKDYIVEGNTNLYLCSDSEINVGGCALCALSYLEYYEKIENDINMRVTAMKLLDGIVSLQQEDGHLVHIVDQESNIVKDYSTYYYDGEAIFALLKGYEVFKDEKYLNSAKKIMDYVIDKYGVLEYNHWTGYDISLLTKYFNEDKYYNFINQTLNKNYNDDKEYKNPDYSINEFYSNLDNILENLETNKESNSMLKNFDKESYNEFMDNKMIKILNIINYPEYAMYTENPDKRLYSVFMRRSNYKVRVDEIQHTIMGMNNYLNEE